MVITAYSHVSATYKVRTSYWACRGRGEPHRDASKASQAASATQFYLKKHRQQQRHPSNRGHSNCPRWRHTSGTSTR
ncbi:protein E12A [Elephant endotheliotropic herpesvirus 3A]|uniref:Protein E12A n=1 Tax=Elephant endotheliotropic herpesvirus 3A TaxID=1329409 RepID=A0A866VSA8_9BETA|nr:protein E12A [Elephant endotheliotropic herpesvirus 3A]QOE74377.1 protein E12A [Elephant endotheliotropic herpesvirus 3A]